MYLYIYKGHEEGPDRQKKTDRLIKKSAELFMQENNINAAGASREIFREEKGKPVFCELPLSFSVSHTSDLWVCLIAEGDHPVGVDIQTVKDARQERIMERYFTEDEKAFVDSNGEDAFFQIWTRKEAYSKYTGRGLSRELKETSTLDTGKVCFIDFEIRAGVKGSCCVKEKGELCIRMI